MLTLTMAEIVDIAEAYKHFHKFGQRLRRTFGKSLSWIAVPEFQKRGAVHFHVLMWGLPQELVATERETRRIAKLWQAGFIDLLQTDGSPKLATYLAKYMTKAMSDSRLLKKKAYSATRNILRPEIYNTPLQVSIMLEMWGITKDTKPDDEDTYPTKWLGICRYRTYLLEDDTIQP